MFKNSQKGVSLYLTVMIMSFVLVISLGVSAILINQIKIIRDMGYSVIAFYAADTGIERTMYAIRKESPPYSPSGPSSPCGVLFNCPALDNGATYDIEDNSSSDCGGSGVDVCISSKGKYQGINRAIEISW